MKTVVYRYIRKELPALFLSALFAILTAIGYILLGQQTSKIIDSAVGTQLSVLVKHTFYTVAVCIALLLVHVAEKYFRQKFVMTIGNRIRNDAVNALFEVPSVDRQKESDEYYFNALTNDVDLFMQRYLDSLVSVTRHGISAIVIGVVLFTFNFRLLLLSLLFSFLPSIIGEFFIKPTEKINQERSEAGERYYSALHEALSGLSILKRSGRRKQYFRSFELTLQNWGEKTNRMEVLRVFAQRTMWTVNSIGQILVIMVCSYLIMKGQITTGALLAAIYYVTFFAESVTNAYFSFMEIRAAGPITEKVLLPIMQSEALSMTKEETNKSRSHIIEEKSFIAESKCRSSFSVDTSLSVGKIESMADKQEIFWETAIRVENLHFHFGDRVLFDGLQFSIDKNGCAAVVGTSGSGKTTLIHLLMKEMEDYTGEISVEGKSLQDWREESLYRQVYLIPQEVFLFSASIFDNVSMFDENNDANRERVQSILHQLGLDALVKKDRQDGNVFNGNLSGGEKKRIGIARALYQDSPILLFDEPTAELDPPQAKIIHDIIFRMRDKTRLVVTHNWNPDYLAQFDKVIHIGKD